MNIARELFKNYDPGNKDIRVLASLGKEPYFKTLSIISSFCSHNLRQL